MSNDTIIISSYNDFDNLAHSPSGTACVIPLLVLNNDLYKLQDVLGCYNPAFILKHPIEKILYICCCVFWLHIGSKPRFYIRNMCLDLLLCFLSSPGQNHVELL